ncbi:hypothetical protein B0T19DRAFT_424724 [Cercophora scortea]|uniref:Secreted protein n=1 Tax=Cercophora scortea TaxID=314031 RepID=A0AAE0IP08_9PEZI|nr:hypothetical protein B0T19DRAFT_424724 [Cercophora scortea]
MSVHVFIIAMVIVTHACQPASQPPSTDQTRLSYSSPPKIPIWVGRHRNNPHRTSISPPVPPAPVQRNIICSHACMRECVRA